MSIPYRERDLAIKELYKLEEFFNISSNNRLTYDAYANVPGISQVSPQKKSYVDIRDVIARVSNLKDYMKAQ